jgi:hypothetical protein
LLEPEVGRRRLRCTSQLICGNRASRPKDGVAKRVEDARKRAYGSLAPAITIGWHSAPVIAASDRPPDLLVSSPPKLTLPRLKLP